MVKSAVLIIAIFCTANLSSTEHKCKAPKFIDNGDLLMLHRKVNGTATFICYKGYWYTGTKTRVCQQNLTWSGFPGECKEVRCDALYDPPNGRVEMEGRKFADKAHVICKKGYILSHPYLYPRTCQGNNTWTSADGKCTKIKCKQLANTTIQHGRIEYSGDGHHAVASIKCDVGYRYSNPETTTLTCQKDSTWSLGLCEEIQCPKHDRQIPFGRIPPHGQRYKDRATVQCNVGYTYSKPESATSTCRKDSTWSLQFDGKCQKLTDFCPSIPNVDNAISFSSGAYHGSIVTYRCRDGYKLTGRETIQCEADRQWSKVSLKCVSKQAITLTIVTTVSLVLLLIVLALVVCICSKDVKWLKGNHCVYTNVNKEAKAGNLETEPMGNKYDNHDSRRNGWNDRNQAQPGTAESEESGKLLTAGNQSPDNPSCSQVDDTNV